MKKLLPFITLCILSLTSYGQANPESSGFDNSLGAVTFAVNQKINMNFAFGQNGNIPIDPNTVEWTISVPANFSVPGAAITMPAMYYEFSRTIIAGVTVIKIRNGSTIPAHTISNQQNYRIVVYQLLATIVGTGDMRGTDSLLPGNTSGNGNILDDSTGGPLHVVNGVSVAGNIWNDLNANSIIDGSSPVETNVNGTGAGAGILTSAPLYVNLADPTFGNIIASVPVNADGSYLIIGVPPNITGMVLQISSTAGVIGDPLPASNTPAGWVNTGYNAGPGNTATQNPATPDIITLNTGTVNITDQNFGLEQLPESAISTVPAANNPGGTSPVLVPSANWTTSASPGINPNTKDYSGGTVNSIRIPTFPANTTSITINGTPYYPAGVTPPAGGANFPVGGVSFPAPNGVPSTLVTFDPIDGLVTVVIPFQSIDNGGKIDPTPGSVTLTFTSVLPVVLTDFTAIKNGTKADLTWVTSSELNTSLFVIERSSNGNNYTAIGKQAAAGNSSVTKKYAFSDASPLSGANYYRLRMVDIDGKFTSSAVRLVNFGIAIAVNVFPNPASSSINISGLPSAVIFQITALNGQVILEKKSTSSIETVTVANWAAGTYIVSVFDNGSVIYTGRFIKK